MSDLIRVGGNGANVNLMDGAAVYPRAGKQGDLIVSGLHGKYYEQTLRGNVFHAATQAVVTTTVGLATTYTGLVLQNPLSSGINIAVLSASLNQSVIQSTQVEAYGLAVGYSATTNVTHTTPVSPVSSLVGSGLTALGKTDVAATLPTAPTYAAFLHNTASATVNGTGQFIDIAGQIVLRPGGYILFVTPTQASVNGLWFAFSWEEVPQAV